MEIYCIDTETTSLDTVAGDVIELSILRLSNDEQKTWLLKVVNEIAIQPGALKINGHKLEDITWKTKYGKENYLEPEKTVVEIENWLANDGLQSADRIILGQNTRFDFNALEQLWIKCNCIDSFPFGRRSLDISCIEFLFNYAQNKLEESYSLNAIIKKYGVVNSKAHTASADTLATAEVFKKQLVFMKKLIENIK